MNWLKKAFRRWKARHWDGTEGNDNHPLGWSPPPLRRAWWWLLSDKGQFTRRTAVTCALGIATGLLIRSCGGN